MRSRMRSQRRPMQVLSRCWITVVVKIPRLPFDKFISAKRTLTTQMKATGEVMSICDNFEGALMKAIRSLEQHVDSLMSYDFTGLSDGRTDWSSWRSWMICVCGELRRPCRRGVDYDDDSRHHKDRQVVH